MQVLTKIIYSLFQLKQKTNWLETIRLKVDEELPYLLAKSPSLVEKKKVLFWSMSPWNYTMIDAFLATALKLRGHEVIMIVSDGLKFTETEQIGREGSKTAILQETVRYFEACRLDWIPVSKFIVTKEKNAALRAVNNYSIEKLMRAKIGGIRLGELASANAGYYSGVPATLYGFHDRKIFKLAWETGYVLIGAVKKILLEQKPDVIVTTGGKSVIWAPIFEIAKQKGIAAINWEDWSVDPCGFRFAREQPAARGYLTGIWEKKKRKKLTSQQINQVEKMFNSWKRSENTPYRYYDAPIESSEYIKKELKLDTTQPIIVIFPNILREDNKSQGKAAFANQVDWIVMLINYAEKNKQTQFVIRAHPAERSLPASYILSRLEMVVLKSIKKLPANVRFVSPESQISSYTLAEMADKIMVWTGTIGLELAMSGRRVSIVGEPGYRGKGFTDDITNYKEMCQKIEEECKKNISQNQVSLAMRYAYLTRFRTLVKFPFLSNHKDRTFHIDSIRELAIGGNKVIEDLCDCIITGKEFIDIGVRK